MEGIPLTPGHAATVATDYFKSIGKDFDAESSAMRESIIRHVFAVARCVVVDGAKPEDLTEVEQAYWKAWEAAPATLKSETDGDQQVLTFVPKEDAPTAELKKTKGK